MPQYREIRIKDSLFSEQDRWSIYGSSRISLCRGREGEPGRDYIYKSRQLDPLTIAEFRLGFVPFNVDFNLPGSCLCGRIVIPIFTAAGGLLALSVRPVDDGIDPKYWNEAFDKGNHLFGLNIAKYAMKRLDTAIVVEGQFDVMSMHSAGITNTIGLCGGAFTPMHAQIIKWFARKIVLLMDGDAAGEKHIEIASEVLKTASSHQRALDSQDTRVLRWGVARLPRNSDPDTYVLQHGDGAMRRLLADAMATAGMEVPKEYKK